MNSTESCFEGQSSPELANEDERRLTEAVPSRAAIPDTVFSAARLSGAIRGRRRCALAPHPASSPVHRHIPPYNVWPVVHWY